MATRARLRQDIKLNMYISEKMDNQISYYAELQGVTRSEFVRTCISQTVMGYELSVKMIKEEMEKGLKQGLTIEELMAKCLN